MERQLAFYTLDFGGSKIPESERKRLLRRASSWLDLLCVKCPALRIEQEEAIRFAICAAADALWALEQGGQVLSEKNGDLSVTYAAPAAATERQQVALAAFPYLCGTGLLYCGVKKW